MSYAGMTRIRGDTLSFRGCLEKRKKKGEEDFIGK